jgi:hypothetical protein
LLVGSEQHAVICLLEDGEVFFTRAELSRMMFFFVHFPAVSPLNKRITQEEK